MTEDFKKGLATGLAIGGISDSNGDAHEGCLHFKDELYDIEWSKDIFPVLIYHGTSIYSAKTFNPNQLISTLTSIN